MSRFPIFRKMLTDRRNPIFPHVTVLNFYSPGDTNLRAEIDLGGLS
jgi:hypothetical protein